MKTVELAAGYSGLYLGMRAAGWPVDLVGVAETDTAASRLLAEHHPDVPNLGDLTTADWSDLAGCEVIAGGIPCQPWSRAGRQQGSSDERDLWPVRKLNEEGRTRRGAVDAIRELRPQVFLLENVASLVTAEAGFPFGVILSDLSRLGYDVSWATVGACSVGACHHRHRVFLTAVRSDRVVGGLRPLSDPIAWLADSGRWMRSEVSFFGDSGPVDWPSAGLAVDGHVWALPIEVCGVPVTRKPVQVEFAGQEPLFATGDVAEVSGYSLLPSPMARDGDGRGEGSAEYWERRRNEVGRENGLPLGAVVTLLPAAGFGQYEAAVRRHEAAFGMPAPKPTERSSTGSLRLAPAFPEWMQGLPAGYLTGHVDRLDALRLAGNGVNPRQCAYALGRTAPYLPVPDLAAVGA